MPITLAVDLGQYYGRKLGPKASMAPVHIMKKMLKMKVDPNNILKTNGREIKISGHPNNLLKKRVLSIIYLNFTETKEVSVKNQGSLRPIPSNSERQFGVERAGQLGYGHTTYCPLPGAALQNKAVNRLKTNHLTA